MNIAVVFSGQGLQAYKHIDELKKELSIDELDIFKHIVSDFDPYNSLDMFNNIVAQPLIAAIQFKRWHKLKSIIDTPFIFVGYSLGELVAACCSANLSFEQTLNLALDRANCMSNSLRQEGVLLSVQGLALSHIMDVLDKYDAKLSILIAEDSFIIATLGSIELKLKQTLIKAGARSVNTLNVNIPSHTSYMNVAADVFEKTLSATNWGRLSIPLISSLNGQKVYNTSVLLDLLSKQINHPLIWSDCLQSLLENQPDVIVEVGPGNAICKMINNIDSFIPVRSMDDFNEVKGLEAWLMKYKV